MMGGGKGEGVELLEGIGDRMVVEPEEQISVGRDERVIKWVECASSSSIRSPPSEFCYQVTPRAFVTQLEI